MHDEQLMRRAIGLAYRGAGYVSPNPMVGAVLVHDGRIIGEGWHAVYGDVHAEVACLQSVAEEDKALIPESTMYVTLEPCAHHGKQPPCAHRLVHEQVRKVVIAVNDPFPQVSGKGIALLREAGIEVEIGVCNAEARWMCRRFLSVQEQGRPYIILKWAQSADGFLAPSDRSRFQLSNHFSQTIVHKWRTEEAAIMVGYNTALADNPQLTARRWQGKQPLRIVLDRKLSLPGTHYLLDGSTETWVINESKDGGATGCTTCMSIPFDEHLLSTLLERLVAANKNSLFVEGGAHLLGSFIDAGLWDEARVFATPKLLQSGVPSPLLAGANLSFSAMAGDDVLQLFQPANSNYSYPAGAIF